MARTYYGHCYLQEPSDEQLEHFILNQYQVLFKEYMKGRELIEPSRLYELSFDELESDPIAQMEKIYKQFGWRDRFEGQLRSKMEAYCRTLNDFKKNSFDDVDVDKVKREWGESAKAFGYTF